MSPTTTVPNQVSSTRAGWACASGLPPPLVLHHGLRCGNGFALSLLEKRPALGSSEVVAACRHLPLDSVS